MRIGGPARYVLEVDNPSEIPEAYEFAKSKNLPVFILGGGANTIAHDEGFDGVILKYTKTGIISERVTAVEGAPHRVYDVGEDNSRQDPLHIITVNAGEPWDNVVAFACERGLTGIEALSKIPGLAGAAPVQNIGAYGQELADTFVSAEVYDSKTNEFKTLNKADFGFSYRKSILNSTEKNRYFIISITLALQKGEMKRPFYNSIEKYIEVHNITDFSPQSIREIVSTIRADKLPDPAKIPSAGSFFKNIYLTEDQAKIAEKNGYPVYKGHDGFKINSGWLIEQAGFSDKLLHGIRINKKAALVLINESANSYDDLAKARTEIIEAVKNKFGYTLEQEPNEI